MSAQHDWFAWDIDRIRTALGTSREGLALEDVQQRQAQYGLNRLPEPPGISVWTRLLTQFHNPLIYVLLATAVITALLQEWIDTGVIVGVVVANALIGFLQETKAEQAIDALKRMLTPAATVLRQGRKTVIPAEDLVPGDIVFLQSGDKVPADVRLFDVNTLLVDEASLTGESLPVAKTTAPLCTTVPVADRCNMAFSSTLVTAGSGMGVVVATGHATEIGKIAGMLHEVTPLDTPLTRRLDVFSKVITVVILVLSGLLVGVGMLLGNALLEMFMAAVALAVSAIPEGLPAIMSITLAIGVKRMVRRNAITRRLPTVETLGSTTVICTDKTGTLTRNEMTVTVIETVAGRCTVQGVGYEPHGTLRNSHEAPIDPAAQPALLECLRAGVLCNDAVLTQQQGQWTVEGDPTEGALLVVAKKAGMEPEDEVRHQPRLGVVPFASEQQRMATWHRRPGGEGVIYVKGAPETVLALCTETWGTQAAVDQQAWQQQAEALASQGLRVLAIGAKAVSAAHGTLMPEDVQDGLALLGLVGMIDPPRPEAMRAIETCKTAGIRVVMITGDHIETARTIATQLGIGNGSAIAGVDIDRQDEAAFRHTAATVHVFARVSPHHKLRLVQALQHQDEIVAMTGDGVNDAPALKQADIGVAMGMMGTEVAKEAADMVLVDDNFASIEQAVEEGRTVFDNLKKTILFILPTNGGECLTLVAAIALGTLLPILPLHILWINLVTTVALALTLAFEPVEAGVMERPPRPPRAPLLDRLLVWRIVLVSVFMAGGTFGLFFDTLRLGYSVEAARTVAVNTMVFFEVFYLFNTRYLTASIWHRQGLYGNPLVLCGIGVVALLQLALTYGPVMHLLFRTAPLPAVLWWRILVVSAAILPLVEIEKAITTSLLRRRRPAAA